jgi:leader peptidase (prepilin peptidase) / N-methyltransferase
MTLAFVEHAFLRPSASWRSSVVAVVLAAAMVPLIAAARIDEREHRIPNRLVLVSAAPLVTLAALSLLTADRSTVTAMASGAVLMSGPLLMLHVVSPPSMGFGDVKAAAALGAAVGLVDPVLTLWALCLASAIAVARGLMTRRNSVPFGSALVAAALVSLTVAVALDARDVPWA